MNKFIFSLLIVCVILLSGCNAEKIKNNVENDYVNKMEEYYKEVQSSVDELKEILYDSISVEEKINLMLDVTHELFRNASDSEDIVMGLVTLESDESYNKFEKSRQYKGKLYKSIFTIDQNTTKAAIDYDESLLTEVKKEIMEVEELLEKAPNQLHSDKNK